MMDIVAFCGTRKERSLGEWGQMGVTWSACSRGCEGLPPAEEEYAVLPSEVATITPSQINFSTIQISSMSMRRLAVRPSILVRYTSLSAFA